MATRKTKAGAAGADKSKPARTDEQCLQAAQLALRPSVHAAAVLETYAKPLGEQDVGALIVRLSEDVKNVWKGDMKRAEAMLFGQAHALQAIFMNLARRAASQEYLKQWEAYMRMALKAQNQCRMTLETLATIKNPPVVIARQANINNGGQQQVNNGATAATVPAPAHFAPADARAGNSSTVQSELLEACNGERLDSRTTGEAGRADPDVEALGAVNRAAE